MTRIDLAEAYLKQNKRLSEDLHDAEMLLVQSKDELDRMQARVRELRERLDEHHRIDRISQRMGVVCPVCARHRVRS